MLEHVDDVLRASQTPWPELQPLLVDARIERLLTLTTAIVQAGAAESTDLSGVDHCRDRLTLPAERLNPPPLVNGHDLIKAGLPAGKRLGKLLKMIRAEQLNGQLKDAPSAIEWAKRLP